MNFKRLLTFSLFLCILFDALTAPMEAADVVNATTKSGVDEQIKVLTSQINSKSEKTAERAMLYAKRGQCFITLQDLPSALADTNIAIRIVPDNVSFLRARAAIFRGMGKDEQAKSDLIKAVNLDPNDVASLREWAVFQERHGNLTEAVSIFSKAIALEPNSVELYLYRAETKLTAKDVNGAMVDCKHAFKLDPSSSKVAYVMNEIKAFESRNRTRP